MCWRVHEGQCGFTGWSNGKIDPIYEALVDQFCLQFHINICNLQFHINICNCLFDN